MLLMNIKATYSQSAPDESLHIVIRLEKVYINRDTCYIELKGAILHDSNYRRN